MRPMRKATPLLLLLFVSSLYEPIVSAALNDPMACCPGGGAAMCCPIDGSCVLKSCQGEEGQARLASLAIFTIPASAATPTPPRPSVQTLLSLDVSRQAGVPALPDPPPRA